MNCRHCHRPLHLAFLDLGSSPPSNAYLTAETLNAPELWFPLRLLVCDACWLVQTEDHAGREALFTEDYAYFSSTSVSWLEHAKAYVEAVVDRFDLGPASHVVEVASNDGYLLQYVRDRGIPSLGVEPTLGTAEAAREKGLEVVTEFFGVELAERLVSAGRAADLTAANNVLAHVPDINDFVAGFTKLLKPQGIATFEFPHLLRMVAENQFDTAYHEHFSYLSLIAVETIFAANGLMLFDVEEIATHGGSLRLYAQRADVGAHAVAPAVAEMRERERASGVNTATYYAGFQERAERAKNDLLHFLLDAKKAGKKVGAYGAAAKGNTMLNFAGVRPDLLPYVVDRSPSKSGNFMPGSRIPIVGEGHLRADQPDYVLILPWNLRPELEKQLAYVGEWGGKLVTAIPDMRIG